MDALILLSVRVAVDSNMFAQVASLHAGGKALRAGDGRSLGTFAWTSPTRWTLPYECDRACVVDAAASEAAALATAVGEQLRPLLH